MVESSNADRRLAALESFLAADPNDSFSRYALALECRARGDHDRAREHLEDLRRRDPNYLALYYALGGLYADAGRPDNAREIYIAGIAVGEAQKDAHAVEELKAALSMLE